LINDVLASILKATNEHSELYSCTQQHAAVEPVTYSIDNTGSHAACQIAVPKKPVLTDAQAL